MSKRRISRKPSYIVSDDDDDDFVFAAKRPKSSSESSQETKAQKKKAQKPKTKPKIEKEVHHAVQESLTISNKKKINVIDSDSDDDFAEKENKGHKEALSVNIPDKITDSKSSKIQETPSQDYVPSSQESEVSQESASLEEEDRASSDRDYSDQSDYEAKEVSSKKVAAPKKEAVLPKQKKVIITSSTKVSTSSNKVDVSSKPATPATPSTSKPVTKAPTISTSVRATPTNKAHSTVNIPTLISSSPTQSPLGMKIGLSKRAKFKPLHAKVQNKYP